MLFQDVLALVGASIITVVGLGYLVLWVMVLATKLHDKSDSAH